MQYNGVGAIAPAWYDRNPEPQDIQFYNSGLGPGSYSSTLYTVPANRLLHCGGVYISVCNFLAATGPQIARCGFMIYDGDDNEICRCLMDIRAPIADESYRDTTVFLGIVLREDDYIDFYWNDGRSSSSVGSSCFMAATEYDAV